MLPKNYRLTNEGDFKRVYEEKRSIFLPSLSLRYLAKEKNEGSRFGFVVSAKVYKKSTERNLLKRRMRAIVKKNLPDISPGYDYIISARPKIKNKTFKEIEEEIKKLFEKSHLYIKK